MVKPTLVILAAGMGSRFGGMKQTAPVGPNGEFIIDYSIYDAVSAGFGKIILVIKKEHESMFRETLGDRISRAVDLAYAYQDIDMLPYGLKPPEGRTKPWGTGHALYCVKGMVKEPFAVINADDFYGRGAYTAVCDFLTKAKADEQIPLCMAGYYIENTLTENGSVKRGLCISSTDGYLAEITERIGIEVKGDGLVYSENGTDVMIPAGTVASMNFFGFMPQVFDEFDEIIRKIFHINSTNLNEAEVYLPSLVSELIRSGKARVKVLLTDEKWFGVTYAEDKPKVCEAIEKMVKSGKYTERLWENGR